ncbi:MAG: AraC family ligand binding domain-containing protein, partial [Pseudomonadota bacterium]
MLAMENKPTDRIERRSYSPPEGHQLDLEIVSVSDLRQRVGEGHLQRVHRIEFHMLICVTRGECTHLVDFKPVHCSPSSLLALHPSQTEQFDPDQDWDGWLVLFRPEFLLPSHNTVQVSDLKVAWGLEHLPEHLSLLEREHRIVMDAVLQMREDSWIEAPPAEVHALLRHQLYTLLSR